MKKLLGLLAITPLALTACGTKTVTEVKAPVMPAMSATFAQDNDTASADAAKMAEVEKYFGFHNEATYVDIRNLSDKAGGYIKGFTFVPFFDFLEGKKINTAGDALEANTEANDTIKNMVARNNGWTYTQGTTPVNENFAVTQYFGSKDAYLFLFCASGTRAGFIKEVLIGDFGYSADKIINVGGWSGHANISAEWKVQVA